MPLWCGGALVLVLACGDSSGTGGGGGAGGAPASGYDGTACDACDRQACGTERSACAAESDCTAYLGCLADCGVTADGDADPTCEQGCADTHAPGSATLSAFRQCRTAGAGTTCGECPRDGEGGAGGGPGLCTNPAFLDQQCAPDNSADACIQCQFEECCDSVSAIFDEPGPGMDLTDCWLDCPDAECEAACFEEFPDGIPAFAEYEACIFTQCGEPEGPCTLTGTCNECIYEECECEYASCLGKPDCFLAVQCFLTCDDVDCVNGCVDGLPDAQPEYDAYFVCATQRCSSQCGAVNR